VDILDKFFQLMFARFRRKIGDSQIDFAWTRASYRTTIFTAIPVCGCAALIAIGCYSLLKIDSPEEQKKIVGVAAGSAILLTSFFLDRRFKKFLTSPPPVQLQESDAETRYIWVFYFCSLGAFALTCLMAYVLREAGK